MSDHGPRLGELIDELHRHEVAFVVIGSVAAAAHGVSLEPRDLDVAPAMDAVNRKRLARALAALEARPLNPPGHWEHDAAGEQRWVADADGPDAGWHPNPADPACFDHEFATRLGRLDVVPELAGRYDELLSRSSPMEVAGRTVPVADREVVLAGMTRPRRDKDAARVRLLRQVATVAGGAPGGAPAGPGSVGFIGFRTDRFDAMVALFRDALGLEAFHEASGATWFRLAGGGELHVYDASDADHAFFDSGPVVGLVVADVDTLRARLEADGIGFVGETQRGDGAAWAHFRAPDGTVMEIISRG